jgi:hypothetical protein
MPAAATYTHDITNFTINTLVIYHDRSHYSLSWRWNVLSQRFHQVLEKRVPIYKFRSSDHKFYQCCKRRKNSMMRIINTEAHTSFTFLKHKDWACCAVATLYIFIWEIPGTDLDQLTGHPKWGLLWVSSVPQQKYNLFPNTYPLIILADTTFNNSHS